MQLTLSGLRAGEAAQPRPLPWPRARTLNLASLTVIVLLAAGLRQAHLQALGHANHYYTAAVTSMLKSWHNFFFVAAEPGVATIAVHLWDGRAAGRGRFGQQPNIAAWLTLNCRAVPGFDANTSNAGAPDGVGAAGPSASGARGFGSGARMLVSLYDCAQ